MKRMLIAAALVLTVLFSFAACQSNFHDPNEDVTEYAMIVTAENISQLENYPNLQYADLRGSTCYEAIAAYMKAHPQVTVRYNITVGKEKFELDATEMILKDDDYAYDTLMDSLKYLPNITHIQLPRTTLTMEQITAISDTYPNIKVDYSIELAGVECDASTTEIDLSSVAPAELEAVTAKLQMLPGITNVELMAADGTSRLSLSDVKTMMNAAPNVIFNYNFELFGQTVSTAAEELIFDEVKIGNEGVAQIREALDIMKNLKYLKMDTCGVDNEVMAQLRDDYPEVKVVWRVFIDIFSILTDETMLRMTHHLNDGNVADLKYCTEITYMDIGHNSKLTDISWIAGMTKLECAVISGSRVTDLSALANCPNLTWLELAFCGSLKDLSPLEGLTNLKYLNVGMTKVEDLSPIMDLPLERFICMQPHVSVADQRAFEDKHPDCIIRFEGKQPYGYGWRYDDYGYTFFEYYANMREVFRYADDDFFGNHKEK